MTKAMVMKYSFDYDNFDNSLVEDLHSNGWSLTGMSEFKSYEEAEKAIKKFIEENFDSETNYCKTCYWGRTMQGYVNWYKSVKDVYYFDSGDEKMECLKIVEVKEGEL